jgi:hypothetical protein
VLSDRPALTACVTEDTPTGCVCEMDVALAIDELKPAPGYLLEPWVRVTMGAEWELSAGISITRSSEEDGA